MRKMITFLALLLAFAVQAQAQDYAGQAPEAGRTYYLWNVGQGQFLSSADGVLTLGGSPLPVSIEADPVDASSGFVFLVSPYGKLGSTLFERPRADGRGQYDLWQWEESVPGTGNYTLANRYRETSNAYLYYSVLVSCPFMIPLKPASVFANGQWRFVPTENVSQLVVLDEQAEAYEAPVLTAQGATVRLKRGFTLQAWNSLCVPFDIPASQLRAQLGDGVRVAEFTGVDATTLRFSSVPTVRAGVPCWVYPTRGHADGTDYYEFTGVTSFAESPQQVAQTASQADGGATVTYHGTFVKGIAPQESYVLSGNMIYHLTASKAIKGFRGWFVEEGGAARLSGFTVDDTPTGIRLSGQEGTGGRADGSVYNLQGQRMSGGKLPRGVYVVNGKKVVR